MVEQADGGSSEASPQQPHDEQFQNQLTAVQQEEFDLQRRASVVGSQADLKKNYKLLKKAFKEEREFRAQLETELMTKIKQYNEQAIEIEELKDRNLELYDTNMDLEEKSAGLRHVSKINQIPEQKDDEHIKEMLGTQNLLREEMQQKEFFKEQAQTYMAQLIDLQQKSSNIEKELQTEAQRRKLEVQLIEEKNAKLNEQVTSLSAQVAEKDSDLMSCKVAIKQKDQDIEELQMATLQIKSQILEKDSSIQQLMETLATKGEETASLSSQYLELKNFVIDQQLFETKYQVTRVPVSEIVQSPNVRAALASPQAIQQKKKANVQRKDLVFSFMHDKSLQGEFFIQVMTPEASAGNTNSETGFAEPAKGVVEKKLIPALDIKTLETVDSLTFSIILHDDCLLNCYDVIDQAQQNKRNNRTSSLINAFGNMLNTGTSQSQSDGGFPMAFESAHVPELIQGFQKIQQKAIQKQQELNDRFEQTQIEEAERLRAQAQEGIMGAAASEESKQ